jgi:type I restriction enzyme S subunit
MEDIEIPFTSFEKQKQIAKTLDKANELIELRKESITKLDALAKSIFIDMFGDPVSNPKGWEKSELSKVVNKNTVVTYGIVQAGEEFEGGIPYIRTGDIVNGKIKLQGLRYTNPKIAEKYERSKVLEGDIVISIRATVGTIAFVPKELNGANLTQGTARIASGEKINSKYLYYFIKSEGTQFWISRQVKGATFKEITLKRLREMPVLLPDLKLQNKFAKIIEKIEKQKLLYTQELEKLQENFDALLQKNFQE